MKFPILITAERIEVALLSAIEGADGQWLVPAYDVPDHWTVERVPSVWDGMAALNRVGLEARAQYLTGAR